MDRVNICRRYARSIVSLHACIDGVTSVLRMYDRIDGGLAGRGGSHTSYKQSIDCTRDIVLFFVPTRANGNSTSRLRGHSVGRRDGLPKGLDVGEVSIVMQPPRAQPGSSARSCYARAGVLQPRRWRRWRPALPLTERDAHREVAVHLGRHRHAPRCQRSWPTPRSTDHARLHAGARRRPCSCAWSCSLRENAAHSNAPRVSGAVRAQMCASAMPSSLVLPSLPLALDCLRPHRPHGRGIPP